MEMQLVRRGSAPRLPIPPGIPPPNSRQNVSFCRVCRRL